MPAWLIPAIISAVGIGADLLRSRAQGQSAQEQQRLYNQWLAQRSAGVQDILAQVTAGGNNPFGSQVTNQSSSSTSRTNSATNSTTRQSTRPVVTDEYAKMEGMFRGLLEGRLAKPSTLPAGYAERGVKDINATYAGTAQAARNVAARKGLSAEATFGLATPGESSRADKVSDFLVSVPERERALQTQDIELASRIAQVFGLGQDSISNTQSTGTSSTAGTSAGMMSAPPNLGALAGLLLPPSPYSGPTTAGRGTDAAGGAMGGISQLLAWLYNQGMLGNGGGGGGGGSLPPPTTGSGGFF